uniref:DUF5901 domain-containing protein n=1 Tax=viral metagenome TaxID=1070528 RepID=A0A6C0BQ26_9ZZZZ
MATNSMNESFQSFFSDVRSNPFIIPLPEKGTDNIKYIKYLIDSRDRNKTVFPSSSTYDVDLYQNLNNIVSLELMLADVPFSRYLIHKHNNTLHYSTGTTTEENVVTIEEGDYENDINSIITALDTALPNGMNITLNTKNKKVTFTSDTQFTLNFKGNTVNNLNNPGSNNMDVSMKSNSIGKVIGFGIDNYTSINNISKSNYEIVSPYPISFNIEKYIVMRVKRAKVYTANNKPMDDCFAILNNTSNCEPNNNYVTSVVKHFNPPLSDFKKLSITFYDYYGNIYDFNNRDHHFQMKFGVLREGRRL